MKGRVLTSGRTKRADCEAVKGELREADQSRTVHMLCNAGREGTFERWSAENSSLLYVFIT
jgi:hypothetical protein